MVASIEPASTSGKAAVTDWSLHVAITYFGSFSANVWYALRNDVQNVTSPVTPTASAPCDTAATFFSTIWLAQSCAPAGVDLLPQTNRSIGLPPIPPRYSLTYCVAICAPCSASAD